MTDQQNFRPPHTMAGSEQEFLDWLAPSIVTPTREGGRPSTYTPEIAVEVLQRMAQGESLRSICRDEHMPTVSAIWRWRRTHERFRRAYDEVRPMAAEALAHKALEAADNAVDKDTAQAARVKSDTYLKVAARLDPDRWGEKPSIAGGVQLTINTNLDLPSDGQSAAPLTIEAPAVAGKDIDIFD